MSEVQLANVDVPTLIGGHHNLVKDAKSGQTVHVYAIGGSPVFGNPGKRFDFYVEFNVNGVTFILTGYVDLSSSKLTISATLSVRIGFLVYTLATISGDLGSGSSITISFNIAGVISGTLKIYFKDGWVWIDLTVTVYGTTVSVSIQLFPLPPIPK
ncbi:hypothetical protein BJV74DRAFT_954323 [Russula compacta]|nr:hypothetical protein BJV74DRAFT_954323 [Russula compacta]